MSSSRRPASGAALPPLTWGPPRDEYDDYLGTDESDMEDAADPSRPPAAPGAATPALLSGLDPANPTPTGITTDLAMDVAPEKKRVEIPKLDENRFLEPDALPFLRHECKKIKFKHGKGHEVKNLDKLVQFYKVWAHRVFPRYPFDRFVERSMRLARTKRVKAHLHEWVREEMGWGTASTEPAGAANNNDDDDIPSDVDMDDFPPSPPAPQAPAGPPPPPIDDNDDAFDAAMADLATPAPIPPPPPADDNGASAKQRALERLAALKQGRFRARINVAASPSRPSASPAPAASASAASAPATPTPAGPVDVDDDDVAVPVASSSAKPRRRIVVDDEDEEDDLELPTIDATWD
ncbi:chromosome segregation in meiosis- protein [Allomyces javanicus]|nr:chromosome segregation in meiosis- protein [Allomyces javanicus]